MITTARSKEINDQIAEKYQERQKTILLEALDKGFLIFGKAGPTERLQSFKDATLREDWMYVSDPGYFELRSKGYLPALNVEILYDQYVKAEQAQRTMTEQAMLMGGLPPEMPPLPPKPPLLWALLLSLPSYCFLKVQSDLIALLKAEERKAQGEPVAMMVGY